MRNVYYAIPLLFLISGTATLQQVSAQNYPANFSQVRVITGVNRPTAMAFAPDGRVFICEQGGNLRVVKNNALLPIPFVELTVSSVGERGLVGVAVDPDFATNGFVYLYYTVDGSPARNRVSRFTANGDVAQAGSETLILDLDPLGTAIIHNGGAMHFGIDGKLYIAVGENANASNAQNLDTYHGKLLRINKDGSVPSGNPYTTGSEQRLRVWASGLRNPFTFAIHPQTGRILVNDVGGNSWEEINDATVGGRNFGWPTTEGTFNQSNFPNLTNPVYAYAHGTGDGVGCAITGGTFFSPTATNYPATYSGRYFFEDSCNDWINTLTFSGSSATRSPFATSVADNSLGMTTGPDGNLYFLSRAGQALYKVVYDGSATLTITNQPENANVAVGQPVTFSVSASGTAPITYQWQKNGTNIPNATGAAYTIQQTELTDAGQYGVIVSNASGNVASNAATLTVISSALPVAEILTPTGGTTYVAGMNIGFSGNGTDLEDGTLSAQSFSWEINFHHNDHKHDQPAINGITSGTFNIPNEGETSDNVWYRIILTVTDSNGLKGKDSVDILPLKSTITFATIPAGLQIMLDGQPFSTPGSVVSVEGIRRTIDAPDFQTVNDITYQFNSWSHGGAKNQTVTTPTDNITYTANFIEVENNKSFFRAINFNGSSLSIDGNTWEASASAPNFSYTNGQTFVNQNIALSPATDANRATMIRSSIWGRVNVAVSAVPPGDYEVWVYSWEDNYPTSFSVFLEGTVVQPNFASGGAGSWKKMGPYNVTINDGTINLYVNGYESNLSGIEIWTQGAPPANNPPVVSNAMVDQNATAGLPFNYTFPANTFSDPDAGTILSYSATLENGNPLPAWLGFSSATRNFSGTPGASDTGLLSVRVTASDGVGGTIADVFSITVAGLVKVTPLITWANPTAITVGTPLGATQLNATATYNGSAVTGVFTYTPPAGTVLELGTGQELSVNFTPTNTTLYNPASKAVTIDVNEVPTSAFYRALNLNGPALVIDGNTFAASVGAPNFSYTTNEKTFVNQNVTLIPSTDANRATMIRSSIYGNTMTLNITSVPSGTYDVSFYVWEDNFTQTYSVSLEGVVILSNYVSGSAGTWRKHGPYPVNIIDGAINLSSSGGHANFSGIEIWTSGPPPANRPPVVANAISDQNASAGLAFNYTFPSNTFLDPDPGTILTYTSDLENDNPLPGWLTFNGAARNFSGTPALTDLGSVNVRVTASDGAGGTVSDIFSLTVAEVVKVTPLITWNNPSPITVGTALGATQLNATATYNGSPVTGVFSYTPSAGTVLGLGAGQELSVNFIPTNTTLYNPASKTVTIDVNEVPTSAFYRALNLNGPALVIDGNSFAASVGAPNFSYTTNEKTFVNQNVTLIPSTDANRATMIRSSIYGNTMTLNITSVPSGTYDVSFYVWEDNFTQTYSVSLEGVVILSNYVSGSAGTWRKHGPYPVSIIDGAINLSSSGGHANFSGIEIWSGTDASTLRSSSTGRLASYVEESASGTETLEAFPNPFSKVINVKYRASQSGNARVELFDVRGRRVHVLFEGRMSEGETQEKELESSSLPDGVYILQFVNGKYVSRLMLMGVQ